MLREHHSFFLPNLLSFTNGNTYLGSFLGLRFRVKPVNDEDTLECLTWYGEYCLEDSEVAAAASFPQRGGNRSSTGWRSSTPSCPRKGSSCRRLDKFRRSGIIFPDRKARQEHRQGR